MSLPKILLAGALATLLGLALTWALNVNITKWVGLWLAPDDAQSAGLSFMSFLGLFGAYVYAASLGTKFGGPKAVRGLIYGVILAVMMVWIVPLTVTALGVATGDARTVYQGPGESSGYAVTQGQVKTRDHSVGDAPPLGDVRPPLAELTAGQKWTAASDWQGRILPFFAGFLLYGLVLGLILSEDPHK
ncbi:hypothetical protein EDM80_08380 [bacterium]|nr:MAG: hypothetical protein EDM80_08380 [bacterium]RIK60835.1 MAG: hypothetical protein DCC64_13940 [Planctomycetota bacterium]